MNNMRNKVTLIGNVGNDPELKTFEGNKKMVRVSVATNERFKNNKGEWVTDTTWHNVTAWGTLAESIVKRTRKGSEIALECKLVNNNYTDKNGVKHYNMEIRANEMLVLGVKQG